MVFNFVSYSIVCIVLLVLLLLLIFVGSISELKFNRLGILSSIFFTSFLACANEEIGWRGFALPKLQVNYNTLYSSVILGIIWGFWHFPLFFILPGTGQFTNRLTQTK